MLAIQCSGVRREFVSPAESVVALMNVHLEVEAGTLVAVRGPSGCGKTTLLNLLAGLDIADQGTVCVLGDRLEALSEERRAAKRLSEVGVVFQDHNLIAEFDCLDNVMLPLEVRGMPRATARFAAESALRQVGVADLAQRRPGEISGGQRQRVGIARALAGDKRILLADEPTGSLDSANSTLLFDQIRTLCDSGLTAVVASHDDAVDSVADRTIYMRDGEFVEA